MVCAKSQNQSVETRDSASLSACLVDGDADQLHRARRTRRHSLLLSVLVQIAILAALILIPILSKTPRIALANVMPLPPYYHTTTSDHAVERPHHATRTHEFTFCLSCPPVLATTHTQPTNSSDENISGADIIEGAGPECSECKGLATYSGPHLAIPEVSTPSVVHVTNVDPALLIHRIEPIFPTLARQTGREGRVELHALIGIDGTVRSLQFLDGDPMFYQSALDAVRQWRYKPTLLNGRAVEVDTHITVIYKLYR
ncbi:MAG TPA: energy transducer TonB [Verrucomicrobiae bacterium]|nr:energy transducer TonB [Verrucomicrobiae bacterium]